MANEQDIVQNWLRETGQQLGLALSLDEDGVCAIEFEDDLTVVIDVAEDRPVYSFLAALIEAPAEASAPVLLEALKLNLSFAETRGGSLGYSELHQSLVFVYHGEIEGGDALRFANTLMNFVACCQRLGARLLAERDRFYGTGGGAGERGEAVAHDAPFQPSPAMIRG